MKRRIGLAALTVLELPPPEQVSVAADAGYDCVGLRLIPATPEERRYFPDPGVEREVEARLADTGLKVLDAEIFRLTAGASVPDFEPALALAARFGATQILVGCGDPDEARLAGNFGALCDLAARYGLAANIEPMPWLDIGTVAKARRILTLSSRENAGVLIDAIHFFRAANSLEDLAGIKANYVQLCDARNEIPRDAGEMIRQARNDRLMPGEGGLDLRGLLRALPRDLPINLEIPYARPMAALERARLAMSSTKRLLEALE